MFSSMAKGVMFRQFQHPESHTSRPAFARLVPDLEKLSTRRSPSPVSELGIFVPENFPMCILYIVTLP